MRTEELILTSLVHNETFIRKVISHIKPEYFLEKSDRILFEEIHKYFTKYNARPSREALMIETGNKSIPEDMYDGICKSITALVPVEEHIDYLNTTAESFCKKQAIYNALTEAIQIADGKDKAKSETAIPSILQEALAVCFDTAVGHNFEDDAMSRYEYYNRKENKITFGSKIWDKVTNKGVMRKTLNVLMAPPHGGKTLMMCNFAIGAMNAGFNVLYITMEMAEEEIAKRFDVNMLNVDFDTLQSLSSQIFESKINKLKEKALGKLVIKQFPTGAAHAGHFRNLIEELKMKKGFVPDMIVVDYMNICASERYRAGSSANSYTIVKSIGEELRALAIQTNTAVWTATQTNRAGVGNSDVDMTNTSESIGVPAIADFYAAIITSEELIASNQRLIKQLKNRYRDLNKDNKFLIGVDTNKMRMYDVEEKTQQSISQPLRIKSEETESPFSDSPIVVKPKAKGDFTFDGFDYGD